MGVMASPPRSSAAPSTRPPTARDRARAEITAEIMTAAREQLAEVGPGSLSLRAIAREVGMVSSAIYRYVPSRDALLTRLIIEAYDAIGAAAEDAQASAAAAPAPEQFRAVWRAIRAWALTNPHQYALIYGSPVPGYRAPVDTVAPATRLPQVLLNILAAAGADGTIAAPPTVSEAAQQTLDPMVASVPDLDADRSALVAAITTWAALFGAISFELFGHIHNVVASEPESRAAFFDAQIDLVARLVGL